MRIIIDDTAYIDVDQFNYTLIEQEPKKKTHLTKNAEGLAKKTIGHYANPLRALIALRNYRISKREDTLTLEEYMRELQKDNQLINEKLEEIEAGMYF